MNRDKRICLLYIFMNEQEEQHNITKIMSFIEEGQDPEKDNLLERITRDLNDWHERLDKSMNEKIKSKQVYIYNHEKPMIEKNLQKTAEIIPIFQKYHNEIMNYLRAKFIFQEIIQPIQNQQLLDFNQQFNIEFMYLVSQRAYTYLKWAQKTFLDENQKVQPSAKYLIQSIFALLLKAKSSFDKYYRILTIMENSILSRIYSIHSYFFDYKNKQQRDIMLCGFEGVDYTTQEHIKYAQQKYIHKIVSELEKASNPKKRIAKFKNYLVILTIEVQVMKSFDCFENIKQQILEKSISE